MKNKKIILSIIFIIFLIIIDQFCKILVLKNGNLEINNAISLEITTNTGMAFGFNSGNIKNIFISVCIIILIISFMKKQAELIDTKTNISLCLILGGAFGNLIDRIIRKGVIDFIKIGSFPIFNIADIFIVLGWILIVIFVIIFSGKNRGETIEKQD